MSCLTVYFHFSSASTKKKQKTQKSNNNKKTVLQAMVLPYCVGSTGSPAICSIPHPTGTGLQLYFPYKAGAVESECGQHKKVWNNSIIFMYTKTRPKKKKIQKNKNSFLFYTFFLYKLLHEVNGSMYKIRKWHIELLESYFCYKLQGLFFFYNPFNPWKGEKKNGKCYFPLGVHQKEQYCIENILLCIFLTILI